MEFTIQDWTAQIVLIGGAAILEVMRGPDRFSLEMPPVDSPRELAYQLIRQPSCALRSH
jgi:hypothetical protein